MILNVNSSPIFTNDSKLSFGFHENSFLCSKPRTSFATSTMIPKGNFWNTVPVTVSPTLCAS